MSTRYWSIDEYGIVFSREEVSLILEQNGYGDIEEIENYDVECALGIYYEYDFTGEAFPVASDRHNRWNSAEEYVNETIYYFSLLKEPNLFRAAYKDFDEIESECRKRYGRSLPDDFDYVGHLCHIVGTYYG